MASYLMALVLFAGILTSGTARASVEPWYFNFGLGYGMPKYPAELQSSVDEMKNLGISNAPIAVDMGVYWPTGKQTLMGLSINGVSDSFTSGLTTLSIVQTGVFASGMHFFGSEPGSGFFLRGDIGAARAAITTAVLTAASEYGLGAVAGGGLGLPLGSGARLLLQGTYSYRKIEGENYGLTSFTVTGLF